MKKIGQKLSFLTKIMLVIGLLISNLSSLSVVFAYETAPDVTISLTEEDILEITYNKELTDVEKVDLKIYEYYTFLDGETEKVNEDVYSLTEEELLVGEEGTLEISYDSIFTVENTPAKNYELFDGVYSVKVEVIDTTEYTDEEERDPLLAEGVYEERITHDSGLNIKVFDSVGTEINLVNGKYLVNTENSNINVTAHILAGGLSPSDKYVVGEEEKELSARELLEYEFSSNKDYLGYLYGEYELPVAVSILKELPVLESDSSEGEVSVLAEDETEETEYEEIVYSSNLSIMYESYERNAYELNSVSATNGYDDSYLFYSEDKDGILYYFLGLTEEVSEEETPVVTKTMLDLYNIAENAVNGSSIISYQLLKDGVEVREGYEAVAETQTIEEYLSTILLDDTVVLVFFNDGLTITYRVVMFADLNNDDALTEDDLKELISQVVGESEVSNLDKSDLYKDEKIDTNDVLYLNEVIKNKDWDVSFSEEEALLDAGLVVRTDSEELVSGDEFTLEYVLSIEEGEVTTFTGMLEYDKEALELVSIESLNEWVGQYGTESGKFVYLGEEALVGPEEVLPEDTEEDIENEDESGVQTTSEEGETEEIVTEDYVLLIARFRALKAGTHSIKVKDNVYYNNTSLLVLENEVEASLDIVISASDDNSLSYLEVASEKIALEEGVYDYAITVKNDVTLVDLKYIVSNIAASVTSTVYPEELVEGENTVVVTVTSESGLSQDYTVVVTREKAEEVTTQVSYNYYNNYEEDTDDSEIVVTPAPEEEPVKTEEEESNLSKIVIIILILIVIVGLVYLIFKDDDDESKKANKAVNKLKKEVIDKEVAVAEKPIRKEVKKPSEKKANTNSKNKGNKNNKKER